MYSEFPAPIQKILNQAIRCLRDPDRERPDFLPVMQWLEFEGRDLLVACLHSACIHMDVVAESFTDDSMLDDDIEVGDGIDGDRARIAFGRDQIAHQFNNSSLTFHVMELETDRYPGAVLCFLVEFDPRVGFDFHAMDVCRDERHFFEAHGYDLILDPDTVSDAAILKNWTS
jgi:hypothetical protein